MSIVLRKIQELDLEKIMIWRMSPEVTKYMYTEPKLDMDMQKEWYRQIVGDNKSRYWIIEKDGLDLGVISLNDISKEDQSCSWAYYVGNKNVKLGVLAKTLECNIYEYVFETLCLEKLWCEVFAFNDKVVKLHEKFGSEIEEILKNYIYKNGEYYDVVRMSISKEKWIRIKEDLRYKKINIES